MLAKSSVGFFDAPTVATAHQFQALLDQNGDGHEELLAERYVYYPSSLARWIILDQALPGGLLQPIWLDVIGDYSEFDPTPESPYPSCIGVGDLGPPDGREDFVFAYGKHAKVYRSSAGGMGNGFLLPFDIVLPGWETGITRSATTGDFDGDGLGDFVLLLDGSYWIFRWDSSSQGFLGEYHALSGNDWTQLERGELSGDGIDDLVIVGGERLLVESPLHAGLELLH